MPTDSITPARRVLTAVGGLLSGPLRLVQRRLDSGVIVVYHRVSPHRDPYYPPTHPSVFRAHLELIRASYTFVPLHELLRRLDRGMSVRGLCAVTFDDGYTDFIEFAVPILQELRVPATHFVTLQGVERGTPTWNYRLNRALHHVQVNERLETSTRGAAPTMRELMAVTHRVGAMSSAARGALLEHVESQFTLPPNPSMLRASDIRGVDGDLVEWGSHTVTHATLPACTQDELRFELDHSRTGLEKACGVRIRYLSYPNGGFNDDVAAAAAGCGYDASFIVEQRRVDASAPRHLIPRIDIGGLPLNMVPMELATLTPAIRRLVRRRTA